MAQDTMAFRGFVWPNHPQAITYTAEQAQNTALYPGGAGETGVTARKPRVVKGKGSFYGGDAQVQMNRLERVFMEQKPGLLLLPGRRAMNAWFTELTVLEQVKRDTVAYEFLFTEAPAGNHAGDHAYSGYTRVLAGENLFHIAARTEVPVEQLCALNSLPGCFAMKEGETLRLK